MVEKVLAKDAKINKIYLTKGGNAVDKYEKEHLWGFYPVRVLKKVTNDAGEVTKVTVFTPWQTKLDLEPDYLLKITDLQTIPTETTPGDLLLSVKRISTDDEAPSEYIEKLKEVKEEEQVREDSQRGNKETIIEELKKGTSTKQIVEKIEGMDYHAVYSFIQQLRKKGTYEIQKIGKGTYKIVPRK